MMLLKRYWVQLTADRKKFGMLCGMIGIGLLLWARLIVISNTGRTAMAEPGASTEVVAPASNDQHTSDNQSKQAIHLRLADQPIRDPFQISEVHFPKPKSEATLPADPGKSDPEPAEDPLLAEARIQAHLQSMVDAMLLDGVLNSSGLALINGRTYRLGDRIPAGDEHTVFVLVEILQRSVILTFEDRQFEMKMRVPGG